MPDFIWEGNIDTSICDQLLNYYDNCTIVPKLSFQASPTQEMVEGHFRGHGKTSTDLHLHMILSHNEGCLKYYFDELSRCITEYMESTHGQEEWNQLFQMDLTYKGINWRRLHLMAL